MTKEEKAIATEKKIECIIGILLLLPPLLSIFCFTFSWFDWFQSDDMGRFCRMDHLHGIWVGATSTSPIYLGLMAIAGAYLIKNNIHYFLLKNKKEEKKPTSTTEETN